MFLRALVAELMSTGLEEALVKHVTRQLHALYRTEGEVTCYVAIGDRLCLTCKQCLCKHIVYQGRTHAIGALRPPVSLKNPPI